jgi:hypothetical protein
VLRSVHQVAEVALCAFERVFHGQRHVVVVEGVFGGGPCQGGGGVGDRASPRYRGVRVCGRRIDSRGRSPAWPSVAGQGAGGMSRGKGCRGKVPGVPYPWYYHCERCLPVRGIESHCLVGG